MKKLRVAANTFLKIKKLFHIKCSANTPFNFFFRKENKQWFEYFKDKSFVSLSTRFSSINLSSCFIIELCREKGKIRFPNFFSRDQESRAKTCSMWVRDSTSHPKALLLQVICFRQIRDARDAIFSSAYFLGQGVQKLMSKAVLILQKVESQFHSDFLSRFRPHRNQILFRLVFNATCDCRRLRLVKLFPFPGEKQFEEGIYHSQRNVKRQWERPNMVNFSRNKSNDFICENAKEEKFASASRRRKSQVDGKNNKSMKNLH